MELKGKRILLLTASFFGYQFEIKKAFERLGAHVDYFDERPANTFMVKALIRIDRKLLAGYTNRYHGDIIERTKTRDYDVVFVLKGESISTGSLGKLRMLHPRARFIVYHWDSVRNNRNALRTMPFFDDVYSFDRYDSEKIPAVRFLPLFYLEEYREVALGKTPRDIDLLFIGTAHSDRYGFIRKVAGQIEKRGLKTYTYFFLPSRILYLKKRFTDRAFIGTRMNDFHYKALGTKQVLDLFKRSKTVIDLNHPRQTGLTMRCMEVLGAKLKLITTNKHIRDYDFFDNRNIMVIDRKNPKPDERFLRTPYEEIPAEIYDKYSIDNWAKQFFKM